MTVCCAHGPEVHDRYGCAAWLGYYEPGEVSYCPCKVGRQSELHWAGAERRASSGSVRDVVGIA